MPLNKDLLGQDLYDVRNVFSNMDINQIIATYGSLENARLEQAKREAEKIIEHFKANILITIPSLGLVAPSGGGPVTGASTTGTIT